MADGRPLTRIRFHRDAERHHRWHLQILQPTDRPNHYVYRTIATARTRRALARITTITTYTPPETTP